MIVTQQRDPLSACDTYEVERSPTTTPRPSKALPRVSTPAGRRLAVACAVTLLTLGINLYDAFRYPMWLDEVASARVISAHSVARVLATIRDKESTPPLWYLTAWIVHRVGARTHFFTSLVALRGLSVAFGALAVALFVIHASRLLPLSAALLAGILVALGSQYVIAGAELRAYALFALLVITFALTLEWTCKRVSLGRLSALVLVTAAGLLTEYFFLFILAGGALWTLQTRIRVRHKVRVLIGLTLALLPLLAYSPVLIYQIRAHHFSFIGSFSVRRFLGLWISLFAEHLTIGPLTADVQLLTFFLLLFGASLLWRLQSGRLPFFLLIIPALTVVILWPSGLRIFDARNLLGVGLFAAIALAATFGALPSKLRRISTALAIAGITTMFIFTQFPLGRTPYKAIAASMVVDGWTKADPVLFFQASFVAMKPIAWYLPHEPLLVRGRPGTQSCPYALVVVENYAGSRWLAVHRPDIQGQVRTFPFYGNSPLGKKLRLPVEVARVRYTRTTMGSAIARGASVFGASPGTAPCVVVRH